MKFTQYYASQVVYQVLEEGQNLNRVLIELNEATKHSDDPINRPAIQEISYGVLRHFDELSYYLEELTDRPVKPAKITYLLLVALYQLKYSYYNEKTYVVVDNAVRCVDELFDINRMKGFVNAVLRNYLRQQDKLIYKGHDYPSWWINKVEADYRENWQEILKHGNQHPPMTLRVNVSKISRDDYISQHLVPNEIECEAVDAYAIVLKNPIDVKKLPLFEEGYVSVQDAGAQFASTFLPIKDGMNILDACSAPGGKTAHLLELHADKNINLTAMDLDERRLEQVKQNLERLGYQDKVHLASGDAESPEFIQSLVDQFNPEKRLFDCILADVPCSASGVVRRHPDIKWLRRSTDVASFATQQQAIIGNLWYFLAENGFLLYVTCSIFRKENDLQINDFLELHQDAKLCDLPITTNFPAPDQTHDGFYYALLQKVSKS